VNYHEEQQNETLFLPSAILSSTPKKRPARLEPLIEEIESSDNTPSYEFKEVISKIYYTLLRNLYFVISGVIHQAYLPLIFFPLIIIKFMNSFRF